ncbi:MAG: LuxR C-terminal-related transcriptional regulator [Dysgonamonadaceae bacterium]|jgi:DNA-binding CsgD family transcriptional regulator|nr:LuxR C-terminal-related transcriptional regulator [Dysgonamonadaceae bacterium]
MFDSMNKEREDCFSEVENKTVNRCLQEKSVISLFFHNIPSIPASSGRNEEISKVQIEAFKRMSKTMNESIYMIDFHKRCFLFVSGNDLLLSEFSSGNVLKMGYDFYPKIVHPDDLPLFINIHRAILQYLFEPDGSQQEIDYFAFNIRLMNHGLPLMVYHKVNPVFEQGYAGMAIFHLFDSVIHKSGNLEIFFRDKKKSSLYSFKKQQWQPRESPSLTNREKVILKLSRQGKCNKEIADILHVSEKTIRNTETALYEKLNVHSMCEAIIYAANHRMIFV